MSWLSDSLPHLLEAAAKASLMYVVALIAVLVAHQLAARARFHPFARRALEHRVTVLVAHGQVQRAELRRAALTESDLFAALRQRGVFTLSGLQYVLYEARGGLSIVDDDAGDDRELITAVLAEHPIK